MKKTYSVYFDTYETIDELRSYLGSTETVRNILLNVEGKSNIWNVNAEREFLEE